MPRPGALELALAWLGWALLGAAGSGCSAVAAPARAEERRASSADGVALAYEVEGQGAPTLLFVHGWCGERGVWRGTMQALAGEWRVAALDLGGHGASGAGRARWTLASLADDVVAVAEALAGDELILIGHSMGTTVALLAAPRLAPRVRAVIGVDSLHDANFCYPPGFLEQAAAGLEADFPRALEASLRGVVPPDADEELLAWLLARGARSDRAAAIGLLRGLEGFSPAAALSAASVPVRVINAAPRPGGLTTETERNRALADFDARALEGVGHFPMLEQPAAFVALLRQTLAEFAPR